MDLSSILAPGRVKCGLEGVSKKRMLENIAKHITEGFPVLDADELFRRLMARERLGSTGIGLGIAIPHCRLENCTGVMGAFFKLETPLEFDAIDEEPVDLIFTLLVPEEADDAHLQILAEVAKTFSDKDLLLKLRACTSDQELFNVITAQ
ncbi:PTS IIA-like nitrogen regulatory protein PtsN [Sessilibacter corallicola]|uniref:PTS IIA-like nitrogen regulatory protein PtsN n=1 Tax=Sessilibacter corallicola TaxID=2904075 RepID=A0ABQ0A3I7_9GAMM|nr:PTS IIA-like nitrogen regulatory protein PtsN [Sessilibacter corallicola]MCE2027152.1 PTS IIA-like nitrogen regulatory protein PtsN [Sessilibacter corallicola]